MFAKIVWIALASILVGLPLYLFLGKLSWKVIQVIEITFDQYPSFPQKPNARLKALWIVSLTLYIILAVLTSLIILLSFVLEIYSEIWKWCWRVETRV